MKNVLILNPCLYTNGGGEKYMGYICQYLENTYHDIHIDILVYDYNGISTNNSDYTKIEDLNFKFGLNLKKTFVKRIRRDFGRFYSESFLLNWRIRKISQNYDLFINWNFLSKQVALAKSNVYLCMFPPQKYDYKKCRLLMRCYRRFLDKQFIGGYDKFINISEFTQKWLCFYWPELSSQKCNIIYPPVYLKELISYDESVKENIIISVGRFFIAGHNKKQREMLKIFLEYEDKLQDYEYHIVGSVSSNEDDRLYLEEIKRMAQRSKNVYIHEGCSIYELQNLYRKSKVIWHATGYDVDQKTEPEKMEHFGITTVEAMSFGVVPVVIDKGGQKEIVNDGINGFLWDKFDKCIDRTKYLIENEEKRIEMAKNAVNTAAQFSIEEFYTVCDSIFKTLM